MEYPNHNGLCRLFIVFLRMLHRLAAFQVGRGATMAWKGWQCMLNGRRPDFFDRLRVGRGAAGLAPLSAAGAIDYRVSWAEP